MIDYTHLFDIAINKTPHEEAREAAQRKPEYLFPKEDASEPEPKPKKTKKIYVKRWWLW